MINFGSYKMLIVDELKKLKRDLLAKSSLKERAFYGFLVGKPLNYPTEYDLAEIAKIYLSIFCTGVPSKEDLTNLIEAQRRKRPISGMHYTKNLIDLSAMAIDNVELEKENLKSYCQDHSTRDFYILNQLFPDISSNPPQPQGSIDKIALNIYKGEFPKEDWQPLLFDALLDTSDLMDFYVIKQGYSQAMVDHPIIHQVEAIGYVRDAFVRFIERTERRVKFTIMVASLVLLGFISYWLVPLIIRNWTEAEPIIVVIQIFVPLVGILIFKLMDVMPDKIKILNLCREKIINGVFRIKGFNRSELKKRLDRLK